MGIYLAGNTELGQLLKLPALMTHFQEHQETIPGIKFLDFLFMHYAGDDGTTTDDNKDSQLPCHNLRQTSITVTYFPMTREMPTMDFSIPEDKTYRIPLVAGIVTGYNTILLQPPRQA